MTKGEEAEFMQAIINLARLSGHCVYHTHDSRRSEPGFPDLNIVRYGMDRPIYAEIKTETGRLSEAQKIWKNILESMPGVDYRLWTPSSWPEIEETLVRRRVSRGR